VRSPITIDLVDACYLTSTFAQCLCQYKRSAVSSSATLSRLHSISLQSLGFVSSYLSPMSLAVSVPRGAICLAAAQRDRASLEWKEFTVLLRA
jgi:hypothetical protein